MRSFESGLAGIPLNHRRDQTTNAAFCNGFHSLGFTDFDHIHSWSFLQGARFFRRRSLYPAELQPQLFSIIPADQAETY